MSRKQAARPRPGKGETERKKDIRAARRALARERRNRPQAEGEGTGPGSFASQLQALGLRLREVPGDGNCLFRALGDQLEGHSRNHLKHRQETVDYMINRREDFEPFVEDDVPFEKHVANLAQPGTFAGNDAIVAFARNNQMNVVIHQLNAPLWQIRGTDTSNARELHIAYRYGEHYDSVRKINDNSEAPARLQTELQMLSKNESNKKEKIQPKMEVEDSEEEIKDEIEDAVQKVRNATGCLDSALIVQVLESEDYNIESTIFAILQMNEVKRLYAEKVHEDQANQPKSLPKPALWEENGSGTRIFGNQEITNNKTQPSPTEGNQTSKKQATKVSSKQKKEQQRLEKKRRQADRHRQDVLASKNNNTDNNKSEVDTEAQVTVVKAVAALNI